MPRADVRDRRRRPRRLRRVRDAACTAAIGRGRHGLRRRRRRPGGGVAAARASRSASGGCARRATGTACRPRSPGSPCARRSGAAQPVAARRRASATATTRRSRSSSSTSRSCARRIGWDGRVVERRVERDPRGRRRVRARRARRRSVTCSSPTGHPGLNVPAELAGDPRAVHAYEPHEYADDVVVVGAGMAAATEWRNALAAGARVTSVRRREPRAAAAQRAAAALLAPRARAPSMPRRRPSARRSSDALLAPSYPPGREWDEPLERAGARFRVERGGERGRAGDLRDRLPARVPRTTRCSRSSSPSTGSETHGDWIVLAPDCTVPGAHERRAHARARRRRRAVGVPGRRHAGRGEVRGARLPAEGAGHVVHAERAASTRGCSRRSAPRVVAGVLALALHRWWPVEIAALMVGVGVALDVLVYDRVFDYQPGWVALPLGALELVLVVSLAAACGHHGAARPGSRASSPPRGCSPRCSGTPPSRGCGSRTQRTAASSDAPGPLRSQLSAVILLAASSVALRDPAADGDAGGGRRQGADS